MLDMELILRFLAMDNATVYNSEKRYISLKLLLNEYMGQRIHYDKNHLNELEENFTRVISFIKHHFGEESFFNLQKDNTKYRRRLYPTIYDSLMVGTSIALKRGFQDHGENLERKKFHLLTNQDYRESITQGTMQVANIKRRISMVLQYIYDMNL
jgi:uncharacterized membrane protein YvbJ